MQLRRIPHFHRLWGHHRAATARAGEAAQGTRRERDELSALFIAEIEASERRRASAAAATTSAETTKEHKHELARRCHGRLRFDLPLLEHDEVRALADALTAAVAATKRDGIESLLANWPMCAKAVRAVTEAAERDAGNADDADDAVTHGTARRARHELAALHLFAIPATAMRLTRAKHSRRRALGGRPPRRGGPSSAHDAYDGNGDVTDNDTTDDEEDDDDLPARALATARTLAARTSFSAVSAPGVWDTLAVSEHALVLVEALGEPDAGAWLDVTSAAAADAADFASAEEERLCGDALASLWADAAARALCDRIHASLSDNGA